MIISSFNINSYLSKKLYKSNCDSKQTIGTLELNDSKQMNIRFSIISMCILLFWKMTKRLQPKSLINHYLI